MAVKPRSFIDFLKHLGLLAAIGLVVALLFFQVYLPYLTNHGESITVPDVVGMPIDEVPDFLSQRDLRFEVLEDSGFSEDYPPLTILQQEPAAETQVKEGRKIYLTINVVDPPLVPMPNLLASSYTNARLLLRNQGLRVGEITYRPDRAEGTVLEQWFQEHKISAGSMVPKGAAINLVLADGYGDRDFSMPLLKGLTYEDALFKINGSELTLGKITYVPDTAGTPGLVIGQFPDPGNGVQTGDPVDLTVYEGMADSEDPLLDSLNQTLSPNNNR